MRHCLWIAGTLGLTFGCSLALPAPQAPKTGRADAAQPSAGPSSVAATVAKASPTTMPTTAAAVNRLLIPRRVSLVLPKMLADVDGYSPLLGQDGTSLIGQDGSSLIGQDGNSLIGQDGNSLVGQDGNSLIGQDGNSLVGQDGTSLMGEKGAGYRTRRVLDADIPTGAELAGDGDDVIRQILRANMALYVSPTLRINALLDEVAKQADPLKPFHFINKYLEGAECTGQLRKWGATGGVLTVDLGDEVEFTKRVMVLRYESTKVGRFVFHTVRPQSGFKQLAVAGSFDLVKGEATSDAVVLGEITGDLPSYGLEDVHIPFRGRGHWEFRSHAPSAKDPLAFTMKTSQHFVVPAIPSSEDRRTVTATFVGDGRGALIVGSQPSDIDKSIYWFQADKKEFSNLSPKPNVFYLGTDGLELAGPPDAALKAVQPDASSVIREAPPLPGDTENPFELDGFLFEEIEKDPPEPSPSAPSP